MYEVKNVDDPCYVTLAVNPKKYFEFLKIYSSNKKHKGTKKGAKRMDFENHAERIKSLKNLETFEQPKTSTKKNEICWKKKRHGDDKSDKNEVFSIQ